MSKKTLFSIVIGFFFFVVWLSLVGNPHVVETVMGFIIAVVVGVLVWRSLNKSGKSSTNGKGESPDA